MAKDVMVGARSRVVDPKVKDADPGSYRNTYPGWRPTLPSAELGRFTIAALLAFATETSP